MKKAVVTGITGQDGSYLAELLLEKGYQVIGVYRRSSVPTFERIQHLVGADNFKLVCGDITDYPSINAIITKERPDEVYNLAAQSHVGVSFNQPLLTFDVSAIGCINILETLRHLQSDDYKPKFYQASTSEMFGDEFDNVIINPYTEDSYVVKLQSEKTVLNPQSPYAIAKLAAHKMTRLYRDSYGMYTASGILFNHESPRRGENFVTRKITRYIGDLVKQYGEHYRGQIIWAMHNLENAPKLKLGNLDASRDWGFAGDYVEAMWLMLQQETGDDFVIATNETHTVREFCQYAFGAVGLNWEDYVVVDPEFIRPAEVPYLRGDATKAKEKLGWTPKHDFKALAEMMVKADVYGSTVR